ncbi:MAG TPA: 2Fe-2S iron-sulfur cluster-binding protein, partial [Burkholderiales bacterium]|nr:2Fe-2S iron-sulfur cluster-binding protein [Burkholderiales bacterium]
QGLAGLGFSPDRLHHESFGLRGRIDATASYRIELEPDRGFAYEGQASLLHAFEEQGIDIGADCRAGHCGACRLHVASGKVRWLLAAPPGLAADEILACCCVPETDLKLKAPMPA